MQLVDKDRCARVFCDGQDLLLDGSQCVVAVSHFELDIHSL